MFMARTRRRRRDGRRGPAPVGLDHGGEGGGHLLGFIGGQPEVGVGQERDVLPLRGLFVLGRHERPRHRAASVDEGESHGRCSRRPAGWTSRGQPASGGRSPAMAVPDYRLGRGRAGEVVALQAT